MERVEKYCYSKKDFRIEWFSGTGPGGQNRNKVQACVRITHIPSGIKVVGQSARSRAANFRDAFTRLGEQLKPWILAELTKNNPRRQPSDEVIRTYHFADNRVTDHASKMQITAKELDKRFSELIDARNFEMIRRALAA